MDKIYLVWTLKYIYCDLLLICSSFCGQKNGQSKSKQTPKLYWHKLHCMGEKKLFIFYVFFINKLW